MEISMTGGFAGNNQSGVSSRELGVRTEKMIGNFALN
jgi:hypothetical protein